MLERQIIRLGYVETDYPYISKCALSPNWKLCRKPGINMEIWREIALRMNYEFNFVRSDNYGDIFDGKWTGLIGDLLNGKVDASLALIARGYDRWNASLFSHSMLLSDFGFARGQQREGDQFQFNFLVFSPLVLGCLFITILLVGCTVAYRKRSIHGFWDAFSMATHKDNSARHFRSPFIVLGFLVVLLTYQAAANSQRLTRIGISRLTSIETIRSELKSGITRLIIPSPSAMGEGIIDWLMQRKHADIYEWKPIIEPDDQRRIDLLCAHSNLLTFGELHKQLSSELIPRNCVLQRVQLIETYDIGGPMAFGFARNFSSSQFQLINAIIGRIFTIDDIERYWLPRYDFDMARATANRKQSNSPLAITLLQLRFGYAFLLAGGAFASVIFVVEKYWQSFCVRIRFSLTESVV